MNKLSLDSMRKIKNKKKVIIISAILVIAGTTGVFLTLMFGFRPLLKNLIVDFGGRFFVSRR